MKALIDADSIVYSCGFAHQKIGHILYDKDGVVEEYKSISEAKANLVRDDMYIKQFDYDVQPLSHCLHSVKLKILNILDDCMTNDFHIYLSGDVNFRKSIATLQKYKGNRDNVGRPYHFNSIREYLINNWSATISNGVEADDSISIDHSKMMPIEVDDVNKNNKSIICTIDKDLDTIPGWHYNWKKRNKYFVTYIESRRNFYKQVLMGDQADNVPGVKGIGEAKATKLLADINDEHAMAEVCLNTYKEVYPEGLTYPHWKTGHQLVRSYEDIFNENAQLIKLLTWV